MKKNLLFTVALACLTTGAWAQINVTGTGTGVIPFDTRPVAAEWATFASAGGGGDTMTIDQVPARLPAPTAIVNQVGDSNATGTHSSGAYWYNVAPTFVYTRPTGVAGMGFVAKFVNGTGAAQTGVNIQYDLVSGGTIGEELPGFCVYYSIGDAGPWVAIPELTGMIDAQRMNFDLIFPGTTWDANGTFYLMWYDDNNNGGTDDYRAIDNFDLSLLGGPLAVNQTPGDSTVVQCGSFTFRAGASGGTPPYTYEWVKDGLPMFGQNEATLVLNNVQESDAGVYWVTVMDSLPGFPGFVSSDPGFTLTVTPNTTTPNFVGALGTPDLNTVTASFDKPIAIANVSGLVIEPVIGTGNLTITGATVVNETNIVITTAEARDKKFRLVIQADAVVDACNGIAVPTAQTELLDVIGIDWTSMWYYDATGLVDLGTEWKEYSYDESTWTQDLAPFDNKGGVKRAVLSGVTMNTLIPDNNPASQWGTTKIPTFYFRKHFTFPANVNPAASTIVLRGLFDDGAVVYLNGREIWRNDQVFDTNEVWGMYMQNTAIGDAAVTQLATLQPSDFNQGADNVLAVLLKQVNATSSDTTFGVQLGIIITNYYKQGPLEITMVPTSAALNQCDNLVLRANVDGGVRPHASYQWTRNGTVLTDGGNISGATTDTLTIANVFPGEDNGNYQLTVTDGGSPAEVKAGDLVPVTVAPDAPPVMQTAVGEIDFQTITVTFNKPIALAAPETGNFLIKGVGTPDLTVSAAVVNSNTVTLTTTEARQPRNYNVIINGNGVTATACTQLPAQADASVPLFGKVYIFSIDENNIWQYNDAGVELPADWIQAGYNDTTGQAGWKTGPSILDAFATSRVTVPETLVGGQVVRTAMLLTNETDYAVNHIPSYYFRKHFTLPVAPDKMTLSCRTFFDDHGMIYINGQEAYRDPVITDPLIPFTNYVGPAAIGLSAEIPLPMTGVTAGDNVIAVLLKQVNNTSSDADMGLQLIATITEFAALGPQLTLTPTSATQATLTWDPAEGTLQESTDLVNWGPSAVVNGGTVNIGTGKRFFRVQK